ncbi:MULTISPECIES: isoprenyl transferase [Oceanobacillus]|uniref:Isoprenyl transferase n=1 Tax=Oceanobacillus kimchii TaxID=746691 RepID=A0ABQ5TNA3_9BACI|nr:MULTISPECIES: isoprenyl transferase [Oceanobacillus]MBT2598677.1 isoprenyl transferase [Oceanobacillus sp. ISL-74]MBT2651596.1 isoprenyl transferase [Oceanobacillus sp. ISL-73]MCT1576245.1 isoprenyl transferase [Oceanobacillus kimchii]MCT2135882.1 isoprenyl transferase [Oceanobacillus kimchii]OEH54692.1 isoprenyl transferase [Oceanobacillus sp. E9]
MSIKIPFLSKQVKETELEDWDNIPSHVAIIMDGNGRWAQKRGLPRIAGHREGVSTVNRIVKAAVNANVKVLTLYTFSTENWKRPKSEVDFILKLPKEFLHVYLPGLIENNVRVQTIGDFNAVPKHTQDAIEYAMEKTKDNDGLVLNFALNYGSRYEIIHAVKQIVQETKASEFDVEQLDESYFEKHLFTNGLSDPDLLIRTGGEYRLSNFMLWQLAYTEFWFTEKLWPEFDEDTFLQALMEYQQRKRRYGGI